MQGILLILPLFIEILQSRQWADSIKAKRYGAAVQNLLPKLISLAMPPLGTVIYLYINKRVTGDWFNFLKVQREHWHQKFGFFAENLYQHAYKTLHYHTTLYSLGIWIPQIILFFVAFYLLIRCAKTVRLSYLVFGFVYLIISFSATGLLSGARYASGLFVLYIMLAVALDDSKPAFRQAVDVFLGFTLCFYTILFGLNGVF
jgi:hypothetical protein